LGISVHTAKFHVGARCGWAYRRRRPRSPWWRDSSLSKCLLWGVKPTSIGRCRMSAHDPKRAHIATPIKWCTVGVRMMSEALITSGGRKWTFLGGKARGGFWICGGNDRSGWPFKVLTVTDGRSIMSLEIRRPPPFGREAAANGTAQVFGAAKTAVRIGRSPALQKERWTIGHPTIPISQR